MPRMDQGVAQKISELVEWHGTLSPDEMRTHIEKYIHYNFTAANMALHLKSNRRFYPLNQDIYLHTDVTEEMMYPHT